jgi:hypothetical protein
LKYRLSGPIRQGIAGGTFRGGEFPTLRPLLFRRKIAAGTYPNTRSLAKEYEAGTATNLPGHRIYLE